MIHIPGESWRRLARCATMPKSEHFFPIGRKSPKIAIEACSYCFVRRQCLKYALDNDIEHGVWGGKTEGERKRMKQQQIEAIA